MRYLLKPGLALLLCGSLGLSGVTSHAPAGAATSAAQLAGTAIMQVDRDNAHYTQLSGGLTDLHLYNAPVGIVDDSGWHFRDTSLVATSASGVYQPADQPIREQISATDPASLAALTSEDGVTLSVGLDSLDGTVPATGTGQVSGSSLTLPSTVQATSATARAATTRTARRAATAGSSQAAPPAVSVQATTSGVDMRITVGDPSEEGPFVFTLNPDARLQVTQDPDGTIRFYRAIPHVGDDGLSSYVLYQTEYRVQPPIVTDSSADPAAAVLTGTATLALDTSAAAPRVSVTLDPAWLHDPQRIFPVQVDLPIATSYATSHSQRFGAVNSCLPDQAAPLTDVVVGVEGACSYRGQLLFDLSSLVYGAPTVASATLWLYTPTQTGPTGVQLFQNAPPTLQPWQMPSWNTATQVLTGTMGLAEGTGSSAWHRWDVTGAVQQWLRDPSSNGGLTLEGTGLPVRFSSPLAANSSDPTLAPYLDIQYAAPATATSMTGTAGMTGIAPRISPHITCTNRGYCDGANFIYGVAGAFSADTSVDPRSPCQPTERICSAGPAVRVPLIQAVADGQQNYTGQPGPGAAYIRLAVQFECISSAHASIPRAWWTTSPIDTMQTGPGPDYASQNLGSILQLVRKAANVNVIPIIDLLPNTSTKIDAPHTPLCKFDPTTNRSWYDQAASLARAIVSSYPIDKMIYYEIGNEANVSNGQAYLPDYATAYAKAAAAISHVYISKIANPKFRVLTGGVLDPTSDTNTSDCSSSPNPISLPPAKPLNYYTTIASAISKAESAGYHLSSSHLGLAVHPYGYTTNEPNFWKNYRSVHYRNPSYSNIYDGPCRDLYSMINLWQGSTSTLGTSVFLNLPLVFTEDNWQSAFNSGVSIYLDEQQLSTGSYLVDLLTWMHYYGLDITDISPIRVMWFSGVDQPGLLCNPADTTQPYSNPNVCWGIFTDRGEDKLVSMSNCPNGPQGPRTIAYDFYWLRSGGCI